MQSFFLRRPAWAFRTPLPAFLILTTFGLLILGFRDPSPEGTAVAAPAWLPQGRAQAPTAQREMISEGEELVYEAHYWAFYLGQIRIKTTKTFSEDGRLHPRAKAYIDSYDNLPFVDLHSTSETEMDSSYSCVTSRSTEKRKEGWRIVKHRRVQGAHAVIVEDSWHRTVDGPAYTPPIFDTLQVQGDLQDGLSIFFFARSRLHSQKSYHVPTIVYTKLGYTRLNFTGQVDDVDITACDYSIPVKRLTGTAEFEGLFGMSGDFEGWFTNDEAAVPIKAKLGVIIGNIELELIRWTRQGWNPPNRRR